MKHLIFLTLALLSWKAVFAQEITTIVLVRHAEKQVIEDNSDPDLTEKGLARVARLSELLEAVDLDAIYSTDYQRTRNTVTALAASRGLMTRIYDPSNLPAFAELIANRHAGEAIMVAGHSNTTPALINLLAKEEMYSSLDESEYDWVFIVDMVAPGNVSVKKLKVTL